MWSSEVCTNVCQHRLAKGLICSRDDMLHVSRGKSSPPEIRACNLWQTLWASVLYDFGRFCMFACLCQTIPFEILDVGSSYLHITCISRQYGSNSRMKVIGSRSRSQDRKSSQQVHTQRMPACQNKSACVQCKNSPSPITSFWPVFWGRRLKKVSQFLGEKVHPARGNPGYAALGTVCYKMFKKTRRLPHTERWSVRAAYRSFHYGWSTGVTAILSRDRKWTRVTKCTHSQVLPP